MCFSHKFVGQCVCGGECVRGGDRLGGEIFPSLSRLWTCVLIVKPSLEHMPEKKAVGWALPLFYCQAPLGHFKGDGGGGETEITFN